MLIRRQRASAAETGQLSALSRMSSSVNGKVRDSEALSSQVVTEPMLQRLCPDEGTRGAP